jgi:dTDP-4-dehydrorhamnose reductase
MTSAPSILVVGADGQVGSAVHQDFSGRGHEVFGTTRHSESIGENRLFLDLGHPPQEWPEFPTVNAVVICMAITSITECEADPDGTALINLYRPVALARKFCERGAFVLFLSTTGVFDFTRPYRRHDEAPCPVTEYGRQKAEAESRILGLDGKTAVLRLTKIIGSDMPLLKSWGADLAAGRRITAFYNSTLAPITPAFAACMIHKIVSFEGEGIFHVSGDEDLPYTVLAEKLIRAMGLKKGLIDARAGDVQGHLPASVTRFTTLDMSRESDLLGISTASSLATITETANLLACHGRAA